MSRDNNNLEPTPPDAASSPRSRSLRVVWAVALTLALGVACIVAIFTLSVFVPGLGALSTLGAILAATVTPHLVIVGVIIGVFGLFAIRRGFRRSGGTAAALGSAIAIGNIVAVMLLVTAITSAGGSVNLVKAVFNLGSTGAAKPDSTQTYATTDTGEALTVSIYKPRTATTPAPTIFYVHGGGWTTGNADQLSSEFRYLADQGWLVVSTNYELATLTNHTWNKAPAQVGCAAVWLSTHSVQLGADMGRLVYWGDSAGGSLAVNAAYSAAEGRAPTSCDGTVPTPKAIIADFPAVDVIATYNANFNFHGVSAHKFADSYIGGSPTQYPDRYETVRSATYLSRNAPETLIIEPKRDQLVISSSVYNFVDQARAAGIKVDLAKIPLSMHAYNHLAYNSLGNQGGLTIVEHYLNKNVR